MKNSLIQIFNKNSFIYNYLEYCKNYECSDDFDLWSTLWIVSTLINRNIQINRPNNPLYPNLYLMFIDENNNACRLQELEILNNFINKIIDKKDEINIIDSTIQQNDLDYMMKNSSDLSNKCIIGLVDNNLSQIYKNKYLFDNVINLYNNPNERNCYATKFNGKYSIYNLFFNCITCSSTNNFHETIKKYKNEDILLGKFIIIYGDKTKRKLAWGEEYNNTSQLYENCKQIKSIINAYRGSINLSPEAVERYSKWYRYRKLGINFYTKIFDNFEPDLVLKLATIIAVNNDEKEITEKCINDAINLSSYYKKWANRFINNETCADNNNELYKTITKLRDIIKFSGINGIKNRDLYLKVHHRCSNETFKYIINIMHELNLIEILQPLNSRTYIYRATEMLYKVDIDKIIDKFVD